MDKRLKDPIYGYIDIPMEFMTNVIDTSNFQRLRRIIQTSYAPLYSSAIHNRFVHSIGVFYLGRIASEQLQREILRKGFLPQDEIQQYVKIYQLACLLHDIGHAPFSHTGEGFYKTEEYSSGKLHSTLSSLVGNETFQRDIPREEARAAAPHELMSCIVGIKEFSILMNDSSEKEFFARCITGYHYQDAGKENEIKNCFISMLNSKVIDVDRLDYLIRDAYITGFESVNIDYVRLLGALTIVEDDNQYKVAYRKDALSIIENVVYAHDAEKKWIQNHPVVLYESYLIQHIIAHLNKKMNDGECKLFSADALSKHGIVLKSGIKITLMCDDDIVYLFKNVYPDEISKEFFERRNRRHPVWKSEAEYNAFLNALSTGGTYKENFQDCLKAFIGGNQKDMQVPIVINREYEQKLRNELAESSRMLKSQTDKYMEQSLKKQRLGIIRRLNLCKYLNDYAETHGLRDDFIIIKANMFNSSFSKDELQKVLIVFEQEEEDIVKTVKDVCSTLKAESTNEEFYYLYYRGESQSKIKDKKEFCDNLYEATTKRDVVEN